MRGYADFIEENVEEEDDFDPWKWANSSPRVVNENEGSLLDILGGLFKEPSDPTPPQLAAFRNIPGMEEYRAPGIDEISGMGLTGAQVPKITKTLLSPSRTRIAEEVLAEAFDKVKNSVSSLDTSLNPGAFGQYFPKNKSMNVNLEDISRAFSTDKGFAQQIDDTVLHEIFHNVDNTAATRRLGKDYDYFSSYESLFPGKQRQEFTDAFSRWSKKGTIPEGVNTRYGTDDIRFGDVRTEEVLATLFPSLVNSPNSLQKNISRYLKFIQDIGGGE